MCVVKTLPCLHARTNTHTNEVPGSIQRRLDAFQRFESLARRAFLWGNCEGECQPVLTSMFYNTFPFTISTSFAALPAPASNCTSYSSARLSRFWSQASSLCWLQAMPAPSPSSSQGCRQSWGMGLLGSPWVLLRACSSGIGHLLSPLVSATSLSFGFYNLISTCLARFGTLGTAQRLFSCSG